MEDCDHIEVEYNEEVRPIGTVLLTLHRFTCAGCNVCAKFTSSTSATGD